MSDSNQTKNTSCLCDRLGNSFFYYSYTVEGDFTFVSSGMTLLLGYSKEEFSQGYLKFLTQACSNKEIKEHALLKQKTQDTFEIEIYKKDRSSCWLEINETPVLNNSSKIIAIEGMAIDISEKKQYENAIESASEQDNAQDNLQAALNAANAGTFSYDTINNRTWWDKKSHDLFSVDPKTYPHTFASWKNLIFEEDAHFIEKEFNRILSSKETHFELKYRIKTKNDKIRWINVKAQIIRDKQGLALWVDGLHLDITKTKELENKLLESEARFRSIVENSPDWIWETNTKAQYTYISPYITDLLGYDAKEILGKTICSLFPKKEHTRLKPIFYNYFQLQLPFVGVESTNLHKNGDLIDIETNASPLFTIDGEFIGFRGIHRNITDRKRSKQLQLEKESAEIANKSKSEFLANMSHELRTPMHAILGFSNMGIKKGNTAPIEKLISYFEKIHISGERLLSLLNDLLDLSKLESGKLDFNFTRSDLKHTLKQVLSDHQSLLDNKKINTTLIPTQCETKAYFDSVKIAQVITNFLSNAIKFSEQGRVISIEITAAELFSDLGTTPAIQLSLTDQGLGVPEGELECIFDKFAQSSKTKTNVGGTGLGLAICKEFIDGHHGRIWAEQNPNGGAVFNFIIPLEQAID